MINISGLNEYIYDKFIFKPQDEFKSQNNKQNYQSVGVNYVQTVAIHFKLTSPLPEIVLEGIYCHFHFTYKETEIQRQEALPQHHPRSSTTSIADDGYCHNFSYFSSLKFCLFTSILIGLNFSNGSKFKEGETTYYELCLPMRASLFFFPDQEIIRHGWIILSLQLYSPLFIYSTPRKWGFYLFFFSVSSFRSIRNYTTCNQYM